MSTARFGYLGPQGTFTEMALRRWSPAADAEHVACSSVDAALRGVRAGELDAAVVPIENSVEGGVTATLDALSSGALSSGDELWIIGEVLVPITFVLAAPAGTTLEQIGTVGTHSHAWAQVRGWMAEHLPEAAYLPTLSTAAAAQALGPPATALSSGPAHPRPHDDPVPAERPGHDAAVCAPGAAETFGLSVLAEDIGDRAAAVTRFAVVAKPGPLPAPTGVDKTTISVTQHVDRPGGLLELLEQFAVRGVNLTRLESRPTGAAMGQYAFSIDVEGHIAQERVAEALMGLRRVTADLRFLGSYAAAPGTTHRIDAGTADADFEQARSWVTGIRDRS